MVVLKPALVAAAAFRREGFDDEVEAERGVAGACVLAVSPASALSVTINLGATTSSVPGAVLFDDFDSIQNTAIGTITGGIIICCLDPSPANGNFLFVNSVDFTTTIATVTFTNPCQLRWLCLGNAGHQQRGRCI